MIVNLVRNNMMKLIPHHRFHVPNGLAVFAALLLLISIAVGYETEQEVFSSGTEATPSTQADTTDSGTTQHKRRGLNLGLLLFRRG